MLKRGLLLHSFLSFVVVSTIADLGRCKGPSSPSSCEDPSETTPSVSCGGPPSPLLNCVYDSLCHAQEADFLSCDCCPLPIDSSTSAEATSLESLPLPGDPVFCGENSCLYDNIDLATSAGWTMTECSSKKPLCPTSCAICPEIIKPVSCGENSCQYINMCMAIGAGFWEGDCCAIPQDDIGKPCKEILKPVTCGIYGCYYDNACLARKAGYNREECCPAVSPLVLCPYINEPVTCGETKCRYNNYCEAASAGFKEESDCCPAPPEDTFCTLEIDPHMCGSTNCEYQNKCWAGTAGFNVEEDCSSISEVSCPYPEPSSKLKKKCRKQESDYAKQKVTCGKEKCTFDNFCIANELGDFSKDDCCPKFDGSCTKEKKPVKCSNDDYSKCWYMNKCRGKKAGFQKSECKRVNKD